jgi:YVTN family beta-propeller protein
MRNTKNLAIRMSLLAGLVIGLPVVSSRLQAQTVTCGGVTTTLPFTDVMSSPFFCQIAEAFFSGLTNGTSATTYSPSDPVNREQMAAFITRTQDSALRRGSKRAALGQFWTAAPNYFLAPGMSLVGVTPQLVASDGEDLWVANFGDNSVSHMRGRDIAHLETVTGITHPFGILVARRFLVVTGLTTPGSVYWLDITFNPVSVEEVTNGLVPSAPASIAFDGVKVWTANFGGSVSILTPDFSPHWGVTNVFTGFTSPQGILFDGSNMWVTDTANGLLKLGPAGEVLQTVTVGSGPGLAVFDGTNIWVPNSASNTVSVVRAATGVVIATLSGNGLNGPFQAAFDGQRILVTNPGGDSVSLWKATDLTPIGSFSPGPGTAPFGACSDGTHFWVTLQGLLGPGKQGGLIQF